MQEFSSISTSAYDAEALAPRLDEKAAEGWSVVAIVPAGTNIVAYLSREAADTTAETAATEVESQPEPTAGEDVTEESPVEEAPPEEAPVEEAPPEPSPVDEPAGWGAVGAATSSSPVDPGTQAAAEPGTGAPAEPAAPVAATPEPEPEPEPEPAAPVAETTVPAGWYADPSGRFELRYWDGNQWTEHVSRDGQQFTDPPVA